MQVTASTHFVAARHQQADQAHGTHHDKQGENHDLAVRAIRPRHGVEAGNQHRRINAQTFCRRTENSYCVRDQLERRVDEPETQAVSAPAPEASKKIGRPVPQSPKWP